MKIKSSTGRVYEVFLDRSGENRMPCPECSQDRKKKSAKSFSFNLQKGIGSCLHCGARFFEYREPVQKKTYQIPSWKNRTDLNEQAALWMRSRLIFDDTLNSMNISSAMEYMPQTEKEERVICFPYYRQGQLVNIKYRDAKKNFKLSKDAELILYNLDSIQKETIIVEGEIDCLSFIQSGIKNVVSVPNGAGSTNLEYLDNCYEELQVVEKFIIGVDNDAPGYKLREELIRRFGAERCATITYGDCKDANEYLIKHGAFELSALVKTAQDVPVKGLTYCETIYDDIYNLYLNGFQPGAKLEIQALDELVTWVTGRLAVVTGIPGHGKSEIIDYICVRLNIYHEWKVAYFSPENHPISYHFGKIASKITGKSFDHQYLPFAEFERVFWFINENFFFINPEDDISIDSVLEKARYLVRKFGIKVLVIDPYNKLDHAMDRGENETQYISRFLDKLTNFARMNGVLVFLIAHPRKMQSKKDGAGFEVPTLYDINGSANFYNKTDYGFTVYRNYEASTVAIHVDKVKFKHWGKVGTAEFQYNAVNGRITSIGEVPSYNPWIGETKQVEMETIKIESTETPF